MEDRTEFVNPTPETIKILCCEEPLSKFNNGKLFCKVCLKKYKIN